MPRPLKEWNKRAVYLMQKWVFEGKIVNEKEFCKKIKFTTTNITKVKNGDLGFQIHDLINIAKYTGVSMDWICGIQDTPLTGS